MQLPTDRRLHLLLSPPDERAGAAGTSIRWDRPRRSGVARAKGCATLNPRDVSRGLAAARTVASSLGLAVDDAVVLHSSNALTLLLTPCDVVARVAPQSDQVAAFEVEIARRLAESGSPVARLAPHLEPRVHELGGFVVTLWTYYPPVRNREVAPAEYAHAMRGLHTGMRELEIQAPRFTDRVDQARDLLATRDRTPGLPHDDRQLLDGTLARLTRRIDTRRGAEQLLHGEPHPGNLLSTQDGPLFIDFETCCRGPVEFDLAHAPEAVAEHYPGIDRALLRTSRMLMLAMVTTWRWDADDRLPDGRRRGAEWLDQLRAMLRHDEHA